MSVSCVEITTPARIHFGMLAFGNPRVRQFGGVGAMVEQPAIRLRVSRSGRFEVSGPLGDRAREFAGVWARRRQRAQPPACRIDVCESPEPHTGVGTGTQLGLAVAAGAAACETHLDDVACVNVSFPDFFALLTRIADQGS